MVAIRAAVMALPVARIVVDGEAVAHCPKGLPDFHALLGHQGAATACLYAFDALAHERRPVRQPVPLSGPAQVRDEAGVTRPPQWAASKI